jgi:hypothetical protein
LSPVLAYALVDLHGGIFCVRGTRGRKDFHASASDRAVLGQPDHRYARRAQRRRQLGSHAGGVVLHRPVVGRSKASCSDFGHRCTADSDGCCSGTGPNGQCGGSLNRDSGSIEMDHRSGSFGPAALALTPVGGAISRARGPPARVLVIVAVYAMPEHDSGVLLFGRNVHVHASQP